jgi:hypothetical protein
MELNTRSTRATLYFFVGRSSKSRLTSWTGPERNVNPEIWLRQMEKAEACSLALSTEDL